MRQARCMLLECRNIVQDSSCLPQTADGERARAASLSQPVPSLQQADMQDAIYAISYAADGSRFASGGADKSVILWSNSGKGLLKYPHATSVQALAFNPVTHHLASACESDLGLWSAEARGVPKKQLNACARCLAWSPNGQVLAVGLEDGTILLRDKAGEARTVIQSGSDPVWSLAFSPGSDGSELALAAASWNNSILFFQVRVVPGLADAMPPVHQARPRPADDLINVLLFMCSTCLYFDVLPELLRTRAGIRQA